MRTQEQVTGMLCPTDKTALVMSDRQGIEIDYCPSCRGIWLDRGELDKILERSAADLVPPPGPSAVARPGPNRTQHRHSDDYDDDYRRGGYRKRKKSFLWELFD
jgi:Zn-finger nucleic acid-binding protein